MNSNKCTDKWHDIRIYSFIRTRNKSENSSEQFWQKETNSNSNNSVDYRMTANYGTKVKLMGQQVVVP